MQETIDRYFLSDEETVLNALSRAPGGRIVIPFTRKACILFSPSLFEDHRASIEASFGLDLDRFWEALVSLRRKGAVWYVPNYRKKVASFVLTQRFVQWREHHPVSEPWRRGIKAEEVVIVG